MANTDNGTQTARLGQPPITQLRFTNWKCFSEARLNELTLVNLIIGQNNSGKSALLAGVRRLTRLALECVPILGSPDGMAFLGHEHTFRTHDGDVKDDQTEGELNFKVAVEDPRFVLAEDFPYLTDSPNPGPIHLWVKLGTGAHPNISLSEESYKDIVMHFTSSLQPDNRPDLDNSISARSVSSRCGKAIATELANRIVYVPHEREIRTSLEGVPYSEYQERRFGGQDAIRRLAQWKLTGNESHIVRVQDFVSKVTGTSIKIRSSLEPAIEVQVGTQRWRNLSQLGAGLGHLVVLGISTQLTYQPIIIFEEPEISLHPRLQRNLVRALPDFCSQAFVTTHSNHIMDSVMIASKLYHVVSSTEGATIMEIHSKTIDVLKDIGARPSSLAQANSVLWVEGPSDAIYLRYWLSNLHGDLTEGMDYVFAFHAGSLLAHMSEDREQNFLSAISEINPNYFLVLDLDPDEAGLPSHAYAQDWQQHSRAWVTEPKEIEGYIADQAMQSALKRPSSATSNTNQSLRMRLKQLGLPPSWSEKKVELARKVVDLSLQDTLHHQHRAHLLRSLQRISDFVRSCQDQQHQAEL